MDKLQRMYALHRILSARRTPVSRSALEAELECSRATLTRLIRDCRDYLNLPIDFDSELGGYVLRRDQGSHELPGLWFNADEIYALLTSHRLLAEVRPGVLAPYITPLTKRLEALLKHQQAGSAALFERIRILPMAQRETPLVDFQKITDALVRRVQLRIQYSSRSRDEMSERWISPQRLIYYRDNWYLDAWCHSRGGLRTFSVDRLHVAESGVTATDVVITELDEHFTQSYGIFAGKATFEAVLHFSGRAARWVADEWWHPEQRQRMLEDGGVEMTVPYSDPTELIMDILKYGAEVEVCEPESLRQTVVARLKAALGKYGEK